MNTNTDPRSKGKNIDFHAHVPPACDHGSDGLETSLCQLRLAAEAGVDVLCATPHFYPHRDTLSDFLKRRSDCDTHLMHHRETGVPEILLGAEVLVCEGLERLEGLEQLCLQGTNSLLLEMPFCRWEPEIIDTVERLAETGKFSLVLAHADRYHPQDVEELLGMGVILQLNVDNLSNRWKNRQLLKWLDCGCVAAIGSDIHGTKTGYRYWNKCKKLLGGQWSEIMDRSASLTG